MVVTECFPLLKAMELCVTMGLSLVEFEGDAQLLIHTIKCKNECLRSYGDLVEEVKFRKMLVNSPLGHPMA